MCRHCDYIAFAEFKDHLDHQCPFRKSMYCSFCACYGHPENDCPAPPPEDTRTPQYLEQLIPSHLVKSYNLSTATPIKPGSIFQPTRHDIIEIIDSPEAIKRYLLSVVGGIPTKAKEDDLKRRIEEYARRNNKLLVWIPVSDEVPE